VLFFDEKPGQFKTVSQELLNLTVKSLVEIDFSKIAGSVSKQGTPKT